MTEDDDGLLQVLACLRPIPRDVEWEDGVRARCHTAMAARGRRKGGGKKAAVVRLMWLAAAAVLCVYLAAVFNAAAGLVGSL